MLLDETDAPLLKAWITKRLETVSDADEDVLSDYILALVSSPDETEAAARANCIENLKDFLGDTANTVIEDLFYAIRTKSYASNTNDGAYQHSLQHSADSTRQHFGSRKRSYHDWDAAQAHPTRESLFEDERRPRKQHRGGDKAGALSQGDRWLVRNNRNDHHQKRPMIPQMPTPPPGMPPFDMNDPLASLLVMQQAMGMLPGFAVHEQAGNGVGKSQRCTDFDTKGYCTQGASCPYEHGADAYIVPGDEYDPKYATLMHAQPTRTGIVNKSAVARGRGRPRGRGGNKRADISMQGANHDPTITSIVVEQIPQDNFNEQSIRHFFGSFGSIVEITLQPYKCLAIVQYSDYDSARAAYDSPKVIFDNRFVKVYWHNPDRMLHSLNGHDLSNHTRQSDELPIDNDDLQFDVEELAKRQEDAQKRYDEQSRQREEARSRRKELDVMVDAIETERERLATELAKKTGGQAAPSTTIIVDSPSESEQTKGLRAQLAKLKAEAKSLGIDPQAAANSYNTNGGYRGRGDFRGRSRGRGHQYPTGRGGWAGGRVGAVKRLDNRPKTVALTLTESSYEDYEAPLRQWLLFNEPESATVIKHPDTDQQNVALVTFPERYLAENFMAAASRPGFPMVGKVKLSWWKADPPDSDAAPGLNSTAQHVVVEVDPKDEMLSGRDVDSDDLAEGDDRWN